MRKIFLVAVLALTSATFKAEAQAQKVCKAQTPTITAKGNFSNGLSTTITKNWTSSDMPLYTTTVQVSGSSGVDTQRFQLVGEYNSITFQENVTRVGSIRIDSFSMQIWGSIDGTNYVSLTTLTATNTAGTKAYYYTVNSADGNPFTHYMITSTEANVATGSAVNYKGYVLVR